jgi:hypothetical protein
MTMSVSQVSLRAERSNPEPTSPSVSRLLRRCAPFAPVVGSRACNFMRADMKRTLLAITLAVVTALTAATASGQAQAPSVYSLDKVPAALHTVTAAPAEYKGRKALKVEFTEAANEAPKVTSPICVSRLAKAPSPRHRS